MEIPKFNENNYWVKAPRWKKRVDGFACYIMCAFLSIFIPEAVDISLYETLKDQFKE